MEVMKVIPSFRLFFRPGLIALILSFPVAGDAVHRMDAQIGREPGAYIGNDVYNTTAGQTLSLGLVRRGTFFFRMQHDLELTNATALGSAAVRVRGNYSRRLKLKVFRIDGIRTNVTAAITGKGLDLPTFDVDTEADFSVSAVRLRDARRGIAKVKIDGVLTSSEVSTDSVLAKIRVK